MYVCCVYARIDMPTTLSIDSFASIVQLVAIRSRETVLLFILSVLFSYKFVARFEFFLQLCVQCERPFCVSVH